MANFWKPVVDGMRERIAKRGMGDEAIMLGLSADAGAGKPSVEWWKKTFPYARWAHEGHGLWGAMAGTSGKPMPIGYCTTVWNATFPSAKNPSDGHGWQNRAQVCCFARDIWKPGYSKQLIHSRLLGEMNIAGKQRGFGRMSADFWPCIKDDKGNMTRGLSARYPLSNWAQLNLRMTPYLYSGPEGALSTVRFEMLREGVEECEARIFVDRALVDKGLRAKLGEELVRKCQGVLDERVRELVTFSEEYGKQELSFAESGWQERSERLYAAAADVARALGVK